MNRCYHCGRGVLYGRRHTHHRGVAGGRWKKRAPKTRRIFKVNLQHVDIFDDGKVKRVKLCTRCMKRIKKDLREGKRPFLTLQSLQAKSSTVKSNLTTAPVADSLVEQPTSIIAAA